MNNEFKTATNPTLQKDLETYARTHDSQLWADRIHFPLIRLAATIHQNRFNGSYFNDMTDNNDLYNQMVAHAFTTIHKWRGGKMNIVSWCHLVMKQCLLHKVLDSQNRMFVRDGRTYQPLPEDSDEFVEYPDELRIDLDEPDPFDEHYQLLIRQWWKEKGPAVFVIWNDNRRKILNCLLDLPLEFKSITAITEYLMEKTEASRPVCIDMIKRFVEVNRLHFTKYKATGQLLTMIPKKLLPVPIKRNSYAIKKNDWYDKDQRKEYNRQYRASRREQRKKKYNMGIVSMTKTNWNDPDAVRKYNREYAKRRRFQKLV